MDRPIAILYMELKQLLMDRGEAVCNELKKAGINHLVWLTYSATHFMHKPMLSDSEFKVIPVCREKEIG